MEILDTSCYCYYLAIDLEARQGEIMSLGRGILACLLDPEMPDLLVCLDAPGARGPGLSQLVVIDMLPQRDPVDSILAALQLPTPDRASPVTLTTEVNVLS